jgi:hypothetical protein
MSDLTAFRDHARVMSTATHKPECRAWLPLNYRGHGWKYPDPGCPGCVTQPDRVLWARLADEADAYLARDEQDALL